MTAAEDTLVFLLDELRKRFYAQADRSLFYRDRRALAKALTWPAAWLDQRGVYCSQQRYRALIIARLEAIQSHGDLGCFGAYFPAYLLKGIQDWHAWHGEDLYMELKHARTAIEVALLSIGFDDESGGNPHCDRRGLPAGVPPRGMKEGHDPIVALASLHRALGPAPSAKLSAPSSQLLLNLS